MRLAVKFSVFLFLLIAIRQALSVPLTVVADKSGEQQVKEALKKAEQEAEKAAKEEKQKNPKDEESGKLDTRSQAKHVSQGSEDDSNKRMKEMAAKLNNLVVKFQKKVLANKLHSALQRRVALNKAIQNGSPGKRATQNQKTSSLDLSNLDPLATTSNGMNSYKEDTRLEDRLALEAEEEKKFNNGETYDDDGGYHDSTLKNYAGTTSLSPKEQASQEMQRYNALISSESSRELSQIQDEISKATQSSMGKVTVQGENPSVSVDQQAANNPVSPGLDLGGGLDGLSSLTNSASNGLNLGNQIDGSSLSSLTAGTGGSQTESFTGNINANGGDSQTSSQDVQGLQGLQGLQSEQGLQGVQGLQGFPGLTAASVDGGEGQNMEQQIGEAEVSSNQHLFNKKGRFRHFKKFGTLLCETTKKQIKINSAHAQIMLPQLIPRPIWERNNKVSLF
eukprot:gene3709-4229_t